MSYHNLIPVQLFFLVIQLANIIHQTRAFLASGDVPWWQLSCAAIFFLSFKALTFLCTREGGSFLHLRFLENCCKSGNTVGNLIRAHRVIVPNCCAGLGSHTSCMGVPFLPSWTFQERAPPDLQANNCSNSGSGTKILWRMVLRYSVRQCGASVSATIRAIRAWV